MNYLGSILAVAIAMIFAQFASARAADYPRAGMLVEPAELKDPNALKEGIVVDVRPRDQYEKGHIPGAFWLDNKAWSAAVNDDPNGESWSARIGAQGIGPVTRVTLYDDAMSKDAARVWWILRYWGAGEIRVLNGGWHGWTSSGGQIETGGGPKPVAVKFLAKPRTEKLATKDQILDSLAGKRLQIVDARSEGEHCGTEKGTNQKAGAIPGAKHLEWSELLDEKTQRFKPAAELQKLFDEAGIDLQKPTATHCQGGGRAAVMVFGMELLGAKNVANYYKSWGEWGNAVDTPVEAGQPKK